ncbi:hypothetical protein L1887_06605 [Cichorium endivia]|nr:hypothetical protein L1887_06605 [Cichorium endivia]
MPSTWRTLYWIDHLNQPKNLQLGLPEIASTYQLLVCESYRMFFKVKPARTSLVHNVTTYDSDWKSNFFFVKRSSSPNQEQLPHSWDVEVPDLSAIFPATTSTENKITKFLSLSVDERSYKADQAIEGLKPKRKRILYFHFEETTRNEGQVARSEGRRAFRMERKCFHEILMVALEAKLTVKLVLQTKLSMSKEARRAYDVTRRDTFTSLLDVWAKEVKHYSTNQDCVKMLIGNKVDKDTKRFVSKEEGMAQCSARTLENVHQYFEELALKLLEQLKSLINF